MNRKSGRVLLLLAGAGMLLPGCFDLWGGSNDHDDETPDRTQGSCTTPRYPGERFETQPDGRVGATANGAWPDRAPERPALSALQIGEACAVYSACLFETTAAGLGTMRSLTQSCIEGGLGAFGRSAQERRIPVPGHNERWDFYLLEVLAAGGDCERVEAALTPAPAWLRCQEDGCVSREDHTATCEGDVAHFDDGSERDCSRSYTRCSENSETGCADRRFSPCPSGAKDRCDGDVKLGCDGCGFVSFNDCSWNGGRCVENDAGAECVAPDASACAGIDEACRGDAYGACVHGSPVRVDCAAFGLRCSNDFSPGLSGPPRGFCRLPLPNDPPVVPEPAPTARDSGGAEFSSH